MTTQWLVGRGGMRRETAKWLGMRGRKTDMEMWKRTSE